MSLFVFMFFLTILVEARPFDITQLIVPENVFPGQEEVEIECKYDANLTLLTWYKGAQLFFRYNPHSHPSERTSPIRDIGTIQLITCGATACRLKLGALTEDATGYYFCTIDGEPNLITSRVAHMVVHGHVDRKPSLEGLAKEYGEGDEIIANCRGAPDTELRWYINGRELKDLRGSAVLRKHSSRMLFLGTPPVVTIQCGEFKSGKLYGFNQDKARWSGGVDGRQKQEKKIKLASKVHSEMFEYIISFLLIKL